MGDSRLSLVSVNRTDLGVTSVRVAWVRNAVIVSGFDIRCSRVALSVSMGCSDRAGAGVAAMAVAGGGMGVG